MQYLLLLFQFQERHHKVIRMHVKNRFNTTNCESGLAEDLVLHTLRDLTTLPETTGLVHPYRAPLRMRTVIAREFAIDAVDDLTTSSEARSGAIKVGPGDAVFYYDGDALMAGDVYFFASMPLWGDVAFVGVWTHLTGDFSNEFWTFRMHDAVIQIPIHAILDTSIWHRGTRVATILLPPALAKRN